MPSPVLVPGIRLSPLTQRSWSDAGVRILTNPTLQQLEEAEFTIRYGDLRRHGFEFPYPTFNSPTQIKMMSDRRLFQEHFSQFTPEDADEIDDQLPRPVWLKGPGHRGQNKILITVQGEVHEVPEGWSIQRHIEGEEFRLHTVGNRIVQCHLRMGPNNDRQYRWYAMKEMPDIIKDLVREAALHLSELTTPTHVIGWDVIANEDEAYILEGNTAPGMNEHTATRIVREVRRQLEESAN